jgi:Flp pilus assembly protein TadG
MTRFWNFARKIWREERGASAVLFTVFLTGMTGLTGAAVDLGALYTAKGQLQNAADAAAKAAADTMLGTDANNNAVAQPAVGLSSAQSFAAANQALGVSLQLKNPLGSDFTIGYWNTATGAFDAGRTGLGLSDPNDLTGVQVKVRRDSSANTPVQTFFAGIVGLKQVEMSAQSTAFRGYPATVPPGTIKLPIALTGQHLLLPDGTPNCGHTYPLDAIAGWTSFFTTPNNVNTVNDYLTGHATIPNLKVGDVIYLNGDSISNSYFDTVYDNVRALFNANGVDANHDHKAESWQVTLPVVDQAVVAFNDADRPWPQRALAKVWGLVAVPSALACGPTTGHKVTGFATVTLTKVNNSDHSKVSGCVVCGVVAPGSSTGGGNFGSRSATAKLVR